MSLRSTNLNLLPILQALLQEQSVSRASVVLGLTQPATSNALVRLRAVFGDPLLVQMGRRMLLTPRAQSLLPLLDGVCMEIESLLQKPEFDPAQAEQTFIVATPDYVAFLVGAEIMETLRTTAPRISVQFIDARADFSERLQNNEYDLAIVAWSESMGSGLSGSRFYPDRMVGVVNKNHPLTRQTPTLETIGAYPELRVGVGGAPTEIAGHRSSGHARIAAEQFMILPLLAAQSDCVAFVPSALAEYFGSFAPISMFELPEGGWGFDACALWSPARDSDPAHRWFRALVDTAMRRRLDRPATPHR